jgi:hypothetical protein
MTSEYFHFITEFRHQIFALIEKGKYFILYRSTVHRTYSIPVLRPLENFIEILQLIHIPEIAKKDAGGY